MLGFDNALVVIPARGGSKGIPLKNLQQVGGHTLVGRAIIAAQEMCRHVVVSSDCSTILDAAHALKSKIHWRGYELSNDETSSEAVVLDVCDWLSRGGWQYEYYWPLKYVVLLQCTSPFTTAEDISTCLQKLSTEDYDSVFSAQPFHGFVWQDGKILNHPPGVRLPRQKLEPQYLETGAVYAMKWDTFVEEKTRFCGKCAPCPVPTPRFEIDTPHDLQLAQKLVDHADVLY